jgi:hypothetical protein
MAVISVIGCHFSNVNVLLGRYYMRFYTFTYGKCELQQVPCCQSPFCSGQCSNQSHHFHLEPASSRTHCCCQRHRQILNILNINCIGITILSFIDHFLQRAVTRHSPPNISKTVLEPSKPPEKLKPTKTTYIVHCFIFLVVRHVRAAVLHIHSEIVC